LGTLQTRWGLWGLPVGLLALTGICYLPSFQVGFYLDDFRVIVENPALHDPFAFERLWGFSAPRFVASMTLAANYAVHGPTVFGFHLVNFIIHLAAGAGLGWLLLGLFKSPALAGGSATKMRWIALITVAIFLLHPLQTQAVTYIVQRYTSLMAMFYLLSMAAYTWSRVRRSHVLGAVALLAGVLAILSKQTAATLPLALALIELMFFQKLTWRARRALLLAGLGALGLAVWMLTLPAFDVVGLSRETAAIGRLEYLATQFEVLWRYLGLFALVGEQRLEFQIVLRSDPWEWTTWALGLAHACVIAWALLAWMRRPLASFGVLFYYLAHAVESSVFPISDPAFEHRCYLPNAGLAVVAALALVWLVERLPRRQLGRLMVIGVLALLAGLTWSRNTLWADPIDFLRHEARLSPGVERAWTSLGKELMRVGQFESALDALERARQIGLREHDGHLRPETLLNIIFALHYTDRNERAWALAEQTRPDRFSRTERAYYHEARGRILLAVANPQAARDELLRAVDLGGGVNALAYLAAAEFELGSPRRARQLARQVLKAMPDHPLAAEIVAREATDRVGNQEETHSATRPNQDPGAQERSER